MPSAAPADPFLSSDMGQKNTTEHGANRSDVGIKSTVQMSVQQHNQGRLQISWVVSALNHAEKKKHTIRANTKFGMMNTAHGVWVYRQFGLDFNACVLK